MVKVIVRSIMKILPGKMTEAMELQKKWVAFASRVLGISSKGYRPMSGGGDTTRTIIYDAEFDSLAAFEAHPMKMGADPETQELMPKLTAVIDSLEVELYTPMP